MTELKHPRLSAAWVIVGAGTEDGRLLVIGSNDLEGAHLRRHQKIMEPRAWPSHPIEGSLPRLYARSWFELTVEGHRYHVATGATYQEALPTLLAGWTPGIPERETEEL